MNQTLIFLIIFTAGISIFAQDYAVIANKSSSLSQVSTSDLKRLYTGKIQTVNNVKAIAVNMSLDNPVSENFIQTITEMSVIDYKSFWMAEQIRGGSSAPKVIKTTDALITFISENQDAIGYVDKIMVTDDVKVLIVK